MGTVVIGKVESGKTEKGLSLIVMPNRVSSKVLHPTYSVELTNDCAPG